MYNELLDALNLDDLEQEDIEYKNIMNLLDNKHSPEELIKEEEKNKEDDFQLESLTDMIGN